VHPFGFYCTEILVKTPVSKLLQNSISWSRSVTRTRTDGRDKSNSLFFYI